jgi:hypothetical protein
VVDSSQREYVWVRSQPSRHLALHFELLLLLDHLTIKASHKQLHKEFELSSLKEVPEATLCLSQVIWD